MSEVLQMDAHERGPTNVALKLARTHKQTNKQTRSLLESLPRLKMNEKLHIIVLPYVPPPWQLANQALFKKKFSVKFQKILSRKNDL